MAETKTMNIKVIDISVKTIAKGTRSYEEMTVTFDNITFGKVDAKKLFSFAADKGVWETMAGAKKGDLFVVETVKNEKGFLDWVSAGTTDATSVVRAAVNEAPQGQAAVRQARGGAVATNWDEKNKLDRERFDFEKSKQALIIRQSSLSTAVAMLTAGGKPTKVEDVIKAAVQFEEFVVGRQGMADMSDDIPE
jgi:hypothetical protein